MSEDDDLIPISALQHFAFCERQWALIHVERLWSENELTAEGRLVHERADLPGLSGSGRIARAVQLRSERLGLFGQADVVEFHPSGVRGTPDTPFPIEYKRGRRAQRQADQIQLCAQAIALEEMMRVDVPRGALFYYASRRRVIVEFEESLRRATERTAQKLRATLQSGTLPKAFLQPKCGRCSLREDCQPPKTSGDHSRGYLHDLLDSGGAREAP